jgi:hypothetical protein
MVQKSPDLFISKYTRSGGVLIYMVFRRTMMVIPELTDQAVALTEYQRHRDDFDYWHEGQRVNPLPETPPVWDGDVGEWANYPA